MLTIHYYMTYVNAISKKSNFRNFFMISLHIGSTVSKLDFFLKFWSCRVYFVYCLRNVQFLKFKKSGIATQQQQERKNDQKMKKREPKFQNKTQIMILLLMMERKEGDLARVCIIHSRRHTHTHNNNKREKTIKK